ncbi:LOW QUALITY PROTEIN: hypothetical protein ACHAW6_014701 [Cyclotella cf. meneghiniana]
MQNCNTPHLRSIEPTRPSKQSAHGKIILLPSELAHQNPIGCQTDLEQTDITLNMMGSNTQNPNLSAHESMDSMFSFDATPMAPIGTECMIHIKPTRCHTWGYHSMKACHFAPAINHYCCVKVVKDVGAVRITNTFKFLHHTLPVPIISPTDRIQPNSFSMPSAATQPQPLMNWQPLKTYMLS